MLLREGKGSSPFLQDCWLYEIKADGYRLLAGIDEKGIHLRTRNGADASGWYPEIVNGLRSLAGGPHIIDGEVVCLDNIGRSDFTRLHERSLRRRWYAGCDAVVFLAFDLITRDGKCLIHEPIEERKRQLSTLLKHKPESVLYVGHFPAHQGAALFSQAIALNLEGVVCKKAGSKYLPGERGDWLKYKVPGWRPHSGFRRARQ